MLKLCGGHMSMFMLRRRANVQQANVLRQCIEVKVYRVLLFSLHFGIFIWINSGIMLISECIYVYVKSASLVAFIILCLCPFSLTFECVAPKFFFLMEKVTT